MIEKVNMYHPDKLADRIAGAIVDLGYQKEDNPRIAVELLLGHNSCSIIIEASVEYSTEEIRSIVKRICGNDDIELHIIQVPQDSHLARNQCEGIRCGDNGIFKGCKVSSEQILISELTSVLEKRFASDGKYIIDNNKVIICQSNAKEQEIMDCLEKNMPQILSNEIIINPLGYWEGGYNTDTGAVNRKLGSDMGDAVTGGGLHGKDLSKADVTINIYCHLKAKTEGEYRLSCAIGDKYVDGKPYSELVEIVRNYVTEIGGFEKLAEHGLY